MGGAFISLNGWGIYDLMGGAVMKKQVTVSFGNMLRKCWSSGEGLFPLCQFPLRQLPTSSIPILSIPALSTLTKWELTKWELTKWEVDQMGIDEVGIDKVGRYPGEYPFRSSHDHRFQYWFIGDTTFTPPKSHNFVVVTE